MEVVAGIGQHEVAKKGAEVATEQKRLEKDMPWRVVSQDRGIMVKGLETEEAAQRDCEQRNARAHELGTTQYKVIPKPDC